MSGYGKKLQEVSSPNLYHFTRTLENLKGILSSKQFIVSRCKECYPFIQPSLERDVPAVCFCDLPKGARANHKARYGYYAISFDKAWANKHGICPVIYCRQYGRVSEYLREIYNSLVLDDNIRNGILNFCKPVRGYEYIKKDKCWSENMVKFLDEREWRYVPQNIELTPYLAFELSDIKNVYVEKESDKQELQRWIPNSKIKILSRK